MSDPRNVAHDKKVIHEKQKHGEDLAEGAAHVPQPGKKTAREESHGAHKETDAEKAGGSIAKPSESIARTRSKVSLAEAPYSLWALGEQSRRECRLDGVTFGDDPTRHLPCEI